MYKIVLALVLLSAFNTCVTAQPVSKNYWNATAIGGHDTVAYHTAEVQSKHQQIRGDKRFMVEWNDARWYFASAAAAEKFAADPQRYRPRYNGHCANALSLDEGLITTDGTVWEFFGDDLHLFYAERGRQRWLTGDWRTYQRHADEAWEALSKP